MAKFREINKIGPLFPSDTKLTLGPSTLAPTFNPELDDYPTKRVPAGQLPREQDINLSIAGEGALIPEAYGRVMITRPKIFAVGNTQSAAINKMLYLGLLWCRGEVEDIEKLYVGDQVISSSFYRINHVGTAGQTVDTNLSDVIAGYEDTMAGLCYSSLKIPFSNLPSTIAPSLSSANSIRAIIKGKKLYDPRDLSTAYSTNFALMFRDLAVDRGLTVDETNIGTAADYCDELLPAVTGEKRRWGGLLFDRQDTIDRQLALIAEHAGCFYVREAGTVKLIPDAPASSIFTFDDSPGAATIAVDLSVDSTSNEIRDAANGLIAAGFAAGDTIATTNFTDGANNATWTISTLTAGVITVMETGILVTEGANAANIDKTIKDNIAEGSLGLTKRSLSHLPNQSIVEYKDQSVWPWRAAYAESAVPSGDLRMTTFRMHGFQSYAVAYRHAVERQNGFNLSDLSIKFEVFDEGLKVETGDIITVTHNVGIIAKLFRVTSVKAASFVGSWVISAEEYDPAIYSDTVEDEPTYPDTTLPDPGVVPTPTGFAVASVVEVNAVGVSNAHVLATWDALDAYFYNHTFEVSLYLTDNTLIDTRVTTDLSARVGPLLASQGIHYVKLKAIGSTGIESATITLPIEIDGKLLPPTDVTGFLARGVIGELRSSWDAASDEGSIWRYEIRYGAAAVTWDNARLLTRVDALSYSTKEIASGTYDVLIKAIDNTGAYSTNEARVVGVVIVSQSANILADWASDTNMTLLNDGDWVTDSGETWNALFPNAMSTYTNAIYSYQTTTSTWTSEELDPALGAVLAQWLATATYTDIAGTAVEELELYYSAAWNQEGVVTITKTAEKSRYLITGSSGDVFLITPPVALSMDS